MVFIYFSVPSLTPEHNRQTDSLGLNPEISRPFAYMTIYAAKQFAVHNYFPLV